jgi:hypothetical protein
MKTLPPTDGSTPLVRTDFSDEEAWGALVTAVTTPNEDEFLADLYIVDDPDHRGLTSEQVAALAPEHSLIVVADQEAATAPEFPLLVVYTGDEGRQELRVIAEELWSMENNISLANMDWEEFVDAAEDGVFRGF